MRLRDLNPKLLGTLDDGVLQFDCPAAGHRIAIPVHRLPAHPKNGQRYWQVVGGEFPDTLSLQPSIHEGERDPETQQIVHTCWHGFITNGEAA